MKTKNSDLCEESILNVDPSEVRGYPKANQNWCSSVMRKLCFLILSLKKSIMEALPQQLKSLILWFAIIKRLSREVIDDWSAKNELETWSRLDNRVKGHLTEN